MMVVRGVEYWFGMVWWGVASAIHNEISESSGQIEDILGVLWACSFADCLSQHFREGTAKNMYQYVSIICIMFQHLPSVFISVQHFPSFNIIYPVCCWHVVGMLLACCSSIRLLLSYDVLHFEKRTSRFDRR